MTEKDQDKSPERVLQEFIRAFHAVWDLQVGESPAPRTPTGSPCDPYTPTKCPGSTDAQGASGIPSLCASINAWAQCWKSWGDEVHKKLWPSPDGPPPPPPPPFV